MSRNFCGRLVVENKPVGKLFDWIGGKKWLSAELQAEVKSIISKNKFSYYVEPFAGGLGSFMALAPMLEEAGVEKVYLNDANYVLINFFKCVKSDPDKLYQEFLKIEKAFVATLTEKSKTLNKTRDKAEMKKELIPAHNFYNKKRSEFNSLKKEQKDLDHKVSGLFLFLQAHCFNGVYRENGSGEHNVPFNWDSKVVHLENKESTLKYYNKFFKKMKVEFYNLDSFSFLDKLDAKNQNKTLFYFDPPYLNPEEKSSENKYTKVGFFKKDQIKLIEFFNSCKMAIYSNHDLPEINKNIKATKKKTVYRKNFFSSDKDTRENSVAEILAVKNE